MITFSLSQNVTDLTLEIAQVTTMFMAVSSWHCHCESLFGLSDECSINARWLPTLDLIHRSA